MRKISNAHIHTKSPTEMMSVQHNIIKSAIPHQCHANEIPTAHRISHFPQLNYLALRAMECINEENVLHPYAQTETLLKQGKVEGGGILQIVQINSHRGKYSKLCGESSENRVHRLIQFRYVIRN